MTLDVEAGEFGRCRFQPRRVIGLVQASRQRKPVSVVVVRMNLSTVSKSASGCPAQLASIWQNIRCSIGFHFEALVGR